MMRWDPAQYARFSDHRSRPFFDLVGRIGHPAPRRVVDLGCGPGELTAVLARRWPDAQVLGIDSSPEMVDRAGRLENPPPNLSFAVADVRDWALGPGTDVVVSNALLQWVPGHQALLARWAAELEAGAWLAFQVPGNFSAPSHVLMRTLAESERWKEQLGSVLRHDDVVSSPDEYHRLLRGAGLETDSWETTYQHLLTGGDPVLEWVRGTGLRPVLAALSAADAAEFERTYAEMLTEAYPSEPDGGTLFAFRRIFTVGVKSAPGDSPAA
jgi:trans-aconitate 2-methyltransferase